MKNKSLRIDDDPESRSHEELMSILSHYECTDGSYDEVDFIDECVAQDAGDGGTQEGDGRSRQLSAIDLSGVGNLADPVSSRRALELEAKESPGGLVLVTGEGTVETRGSTGCGDDVKVNLVHVDFVISVEKQRIQRSGMSRDLVADVCGEESGSIRAMFPGHHQQECADLSSGEATEDEAFRVLREAERRAMERRLVSGGRNRSRRFVIDKEEEYLRIEDATGLKDLKNRSLVGKIHKKGGNGRYQHNWFTLRENFLTCYNGRRHRMSEQECLSERDGDLRDPVDATFFFKKKYTLDLTNTKMYLVKQPGILSCMPWRQSFDVDDGLIDITDEMKIVRITPTCGHFTVQLQNGAVETNVKTRTLDFALRSHDGIYFYRSKDIDSFLNWMIAFAFRQGRIICDIG